MSYKLLFASSLIAQGSYAWWGTGHLLTARIAYDYLIATDNEDVIELVESQLETLSGFVHSEKNHPFVECATFADYIKNSGWNSLSTWHYADTPFFDEGYSKVVYQDTENVTWAIDQMRSSILDPVGQVYGPVPKITPVDVTLSRSFNIRLLIHYFGDIHQPLHSVSRFTSNYPDGDAGGNLFLIPASGPDGEVTNLHAVWDSVGYAYADFIEQPLSESDWTYLGVESFKIALENPYEGFDKVEMAAPEQDWYKETLELSKTDVYPGAVENTPLSDEYITNTVKVAKRQLAKGGYRLADFLVKMKKDFDQI